MPGGTQRRAEEGREEEGTHPGESRSIKPKVPPRQEVGWQLLPTPGEDASRKRWLPSNVTSSRPLLTISYQRWHANSFGPPRCWNAPIANCGASSARSAALSVQRARRSPSFCRSNGSMLAGPSNPGGRSLDSSPSRFLLSTLSNGYATLDCQEFNAIQGCNGLEAVFLMC
jgi:hypothetical protein